MSHAEWACDLCGKGSTTATKNEAVAQAEAHLAAIHSVIPEVVDETS